MNKPRSILDPRFRYVPAAKTDIRKTFARVRRELARANARPVDIRPLPIKEARGGRS